MRVGTTYCRTGHGGSALWWQHLGGTNPVSKSGREGTDFIGISRLEIYMEVAEDSARVWKARLDTDNLVSFAGKQT